MLTVKIVDDDGEGVYSDVTNAGWSKAEKQVFLIQRGAAEGGNPLRIIVSKGEVQVLQAGTLVAQWTAGG